MKVYQAAVLRYQHSAVLGELVNVGVVIFCAADLQLVFRLSKRYGRLSNLYPDFNGRSYKAIIGMVEATWEKMAKALQVGLFSLEKATPGSLADLQPKLVSPENTLLYWSEAMGGVCDDIDQTADELFEEFVSNLEAKHHTTRRDEKEMRHLLNKRIHANAALYKNLSAVELKGPQHSYRFEYSWMNGKRQVLEPISLDYSRPAEITQKAETWSGRLHLLEEDFGMIAVIAMPQRGTPGWEAAVNARRILRAQGKVRCVVEEDDFERATDLIEQDLANHSP